MIIELNIKDEKAETFLSFLKELDFVKINSKIDERKPILKKNSLESFVAEDDDLSDCISSEEFKKLLMADLEKKYKEKVNIR